MEYLKEALIKIPEWWIRQDIPFTLTIGIPILIVACIFIYMNRKVLLLSALMLIILTTAFFIALAKLYNKFF